MRHIPFFLALGISLNAYAEPLIHSARFSELAIYPDHSAPAQVVPAQQPTLSAQTTGTIEKLVVDVGSRVKQGQLLLSLNCTAQQANHNMAKAQLDSNQSQLEFARHELSRGQSLYKAKHISDQEMEQRQLNVAQLESAVANARSQLTQAQLQMSYCQVKAPFDGVITRRMAQVGALASPGTALLEMIDDQHAVVEAFIQPQDLEGLRHSQQRKLMTNGQSYALEAPRAIPLVDKQTRNQTVRLGFAGKTAIAGSAGRLYWQEAIPHIPPQYLVKRNGQIGLFVADQGKARFVSAQQALEGTPAAFDLNPDTLVITQGQQALNDGDSL